MPGRQFVSSSTYRYGFNGKEKDDEVKGGGNSYDFGERIYDPRIAKFFTKDLLANIFSWQSPYAFAANSPIKFIDVNGNGPKDRVKAAKQLIGYKYSNQKINTGSAMRTTYTKEALEYQDCAELVCRVMKADGITSKIEYYLTKKEQGKSYIGNQLFNTDLYEHSNTPKVGDIAFWEGHVGIVSSVDKDGKFKLVHAANSKYGVLENGYHIKASQYRDGEFHGFYRPKNETKDDKKIDMFSDNGLSGAIANKSEGSEYSKYMSAATSYYKQAQVLYTQANNESDPDFKSEFRRKGDELNNKGTENYNKSLELKK